jgi:hypothetical protein
LRGNATNTVSTQNGGVGDWVQWEQEETNSGYFFLIHKATGKKLQGNSSYKVSLVDPSKNGTWEQWKWVDAGGGWYRLENRGHNRWLHVGANGTSNWTIGPKTWQGNNTKWKFTNQSTNKSRSEKAISETDDVQELRLYPNPTTRALNITGIKSDSVVEIFAYTGQKVLSSKGASEIDVSMLSNGMYFVKVDNSVLKFLKK